MVIADSQAHASEMAKAVVVKYKSRGKPILSIEEAIAKESYHSLGDLEPINIGNIEGALVISSFHVFLFMYNFFFIQILYPNQSMLYQVKSSAQVSIIFTWRLTYASII